MVSVTDFNDLEICGKDYDSEYFSLCINIQSLFGFKVSDIDKNIFNTVFLCTSLKLYTYFQINYL